MSRWPDASFDLEIPWTFRDPYTDWELPGDLIICVHGWGDVTTGRADGWEITGICEVFPNGVSKRRFHLDTKRPIVGAIIEVLNDDKDAEGKRFNEAVHEAAYAQWRAAA